MARPYPGSAGAMAHDPPAAVILDVDGTLLDTNYLHILAWWQSFLDAGEQVSCYDISRQIGRSSGDLVQHLIGQHDPAIVQGHSERWAPLRERMIPFHRAADLVWACHRRGLRVVWATSGSDDDVRDARARLDCDDAVHAVVNGAEVEHGKPAPDIVRAALQAAGVPAERAVMVGDTVYDVRAARAAGVACIALLAGGIGEAELRQDDPAAIYGNCSDLLDDLAASPVGALLR